MQAFRIFNVNVDVNIVLMRVIVVAAHMMIICMMIVCVRLCGAS